MTTITIPATPTEADALDAMRSLTTEASRWALADILVKLIPSGNEGFAHLAAKSDDMPKRLTEVTLRLYRDTAAWWPADKRRPDVTFTAHREAMKMGGVDAAAELLGDMVRNVGPSGLKVIAVRKAVAIKLGNPVPGSATTRAAGAQSDAQVLKDLKAGATHLIATITSATSASDLDHLLKGVKKLEGHIEKLRTKAALASKKANAPVAKGTTTQAPSAPTNGKAAPAGAARKRAGDLRGLNRPTPKAPAADPAPEGEAK